MPRIQIPDDDDWMFDLPTIIPARGEPDPQLARWRENADRAAYEERESVGNVTLIISKALRAFGRSKTAEKKAS